MVEYVELADEAEKGEKGSATSQFSVLDMSYIAHSGGQSSPKFGSMLSEALSIENEYARIEQLKSRQKPSRALQQEHEEPTQLPIRTAAQQLRENKAQPQPAKKPMPTNIFNFNLSSNANAPKAVSEKPKREEVQQNLPQKSFQEMQGPEHVERSAALDGKEAIKQTQFDARSVEKERMEVELAELQKRKDELESAASTKEQKLKEYQERLEHTKNALGKAQDALHSSKSDYESMVQQQSSDAASLQQQIEQLVSKQKGLEETIAGTSKSDSEKREKLKSLEDERSVLSEEIKSLREKKGGIETSAKSESEQLDKYYKKLSDTKSELVSAQTELKDARYKYESMRKETEKESAALNDNISNLDRQRQELEARIRKNRIMQEQMELEFQKRKDEISKQEESAKNAAAEKAKNEKERLRREAADKAKKEMEELAKKMEGTSPVAPSFKVGPSGLVMTRLSTADQASELEKIIEGMQENAFNDVQLKVIKKEVHGLMRELSRKREKYSVGSTDLERSISILRDERLREAIAILGAS